MKKITVDELKHHVTYRPHSQLNHQNEGALYGLPLLYRTKAVCQNIAMVTV